MTGQVGPDAQIALAEAQRREGLFQLFRVKNTHDELFAKRCRHGGEPQFHFFAQRRFSFHAPVLWTTLVCHIHASQAFDATDDGPEYRRGHLVHQMQHAVNPEPDIALIAPRFEMNVTGPLLEGVLQQPVDQVNDVTVVRIRLSHFA